MKDEISIVFRSVEHAIAASLCLFMPVYLFFWFTQTVSFAKAYSLGTTLVIALVYAFFRICTSVDAAKSSLSENKKILNDRLISGVFAGVAICGVLAYTAYDVRQTQEVRNERTSRLAQEKSLLPSCYDIGVQYGRAAARGIDDEQAYEGRDVLIPENCRNRRETNKGIEMGIKLSRS